MGLYDMLNKYQINILPLQKIHPIGINCVSFIMVILSLFLVPVKVSAKQIKIAPNIPLQKQITKARQQYIIYEPIDLNSQTVKLPEGITLIFKGNGCMHNGKIVGNNTSIKAKDREIFVHGQSSYRGYRTSDGAYKYCINREDAVEISGTWNNSKCKRNWTGLLSIKENECASLAINNFIRLHQNKSTVVIPKKDYYVYSTITNNSKSINFSDSRLQMIDYSKVEDKTLALPRNSKPEALKHPGDMVQISGNGICISNLIIDGRSNITGEAASALGEEHCIRISNCTNSNFTNIKLYNAIDCGFAMNKTTSDIAFNNVEWNNIGEHGVYTHSEHGTLSFRNCKFINCGQSEVVNKLRNGLSACVRPRLNQDEILENRSLVLDFSNCVFSNSGNIKVMTCYSGAVKCIFSYCSWMGNILGYAGGTELSQALGHCIPYVFKECANPPSRYSGYDTKRYLFSCTDVYNLFEDTFVAEDCKCILAYSDVYNRFSEKFSKEVSGDTTFISNCKIVSQAKYDNKIPRIKVHNPRPMCFDHCTIDLEPDHLNGQHFYMLSFVSDLSKEASGCGTLLISNCNFNMGGLYFMEAVGTSVDIKNSRIEGYGKYFINGKGGTNELTCDNKEQTSLVSNTIK